MDNAYFKFKMEISGSPTDVLSIFEVLKSYHTGHNGVKIDLEIQGKNISDLRDDDILSFLAENGTVCVSGDGPYGPYDELNEVDIFRDASEAAPHAQFSANIEGMRSYDEQNLSCQLKDGILNIHTEIFDNFSIDSEYIEYVAKQLPYEKFIKIYKIDKDTLERDDYENLLAELYDEVTSDDSILDVKFDDFIAVLDDNGIDSELKEGDYYDALGTLKISSKWDFVFENNIGIEEFSYDPISKEYI